MVEELFGIDFGTTNSATVGILHSKERRYGDGEGQPYPSLIAIEKSTGNVVSRGRDAWKRREELREKCEIIFSVKLLLGSGKTWLIGGKEWTAEEIVTEIFKGLKKEIRERHPETSNMDILKALIAIPVDFESAKRKFRTPDFGEFDVIPNQKSGAGLSPENWFRNHSVHHTVWPRICCVAGLSYYEEPLSALESQKFFVA